MGHCSMSGDPYEILLTQGILLLPNKLRVKFEVETIISRRDIVF